MPRFVPKIIGNDKIERWIDVKKLEESQNNNELALESRENFLHTLSTIIGHSEQDFIIHMKKILAPLAVDKGIIKEIYQKLTTLSNHFEWPVPILPWEWNTYKMTTSISEFKLLRDEVIEYAKKRNYKTDKYKKLSPSSWSNRSCMFFDIYLKDYNLRIELDGSQHDQFPQLQIDQCSDSYFSELYNIKTIRLCQFSRRYPNKKFMEYEMNELLVELYQRLKESPKKLRDLNEDAVLMTIYSKEWKGLEKISPENLIYEKEQHKEGYPMTSSAEA